MNQLLADLFLALPRGLTDPRVFGSVWLTLCILGYVAFVRGPITRAVRAHCSASYLSTHLPRPWHRILYGAARKKAKLDEGGLYTTNLAVLLTLAGTVAVHVALFVLSYRLPALATVDRILLTAVVGVMAFLCLVTQPATTLERRMRWGFGRASSVLCAVAWDLLIVAALFLWLYDAWFLPAFII
ncbi:MAG: hypothetical protein J6R04_08665 [Clostridia bacterium]|nr:hypothetical protein [Clostridia bacterium]